MVYPQKFKSFAVMLSHLNIRYVPNMYNFIMELYFCFQIRADGAASASGVWNVDICKVVFPKCLFHFLCLCICICMCLCLFAFSLEQMRVHQVCGMLRYAELGAGADVLYEISFHLHIITLSYTHTQQQQQQQQRS